MSVKFSGPCLSPSSSLPPVRSLVTASEGQVTSALRSLHALYCPLRLTTAFSKPKLAPEYIPAASTPIPVDSGYASQDEDEDDNDDSEMTESLRTDPFERTFATRWLTSLISRAEEMHLSDEARSLMVDDAASILSSFFDSTHDDVEEALTRDFSFPTCSDASVKVTLNDAPLSGTDHTDVGLQSWGASIVLSSMMCADPERFSLTEIGSSDAKIFELGAGTGLVSLIIARLLPKIGVEGAKITATDYHPAVLENCRANVVTNFGSSSDGSAPVDTLILDWAAPPADLRGTAELLIASDVVYAPDHAAWLRDCAAHLLAPSGTFWLMVTVRRTGKFEGIPNTVEAAFEPELCPRDDAGRVFRILKKECVEKRRGIGRGDESGYDLYKIGWA